MKSKIMLGILLFSIVFLSMNAASFAQEQVAKDSIISKQPVKKDILSLKQDTSDIINSKAVNKDIVKMKPVTKDITTKKDVTEKDDTIVAEDIVVGKTANGKTIYQNIRGGKYILSATGKKVYIKKDLK